MSERPILFSGEMVHAILDGRKTQTRRVVRWPRWCPDEFDRLKFAAGFRGHPRLGWFADGSGAVSWGCPFGVAGERLWVRETWHSCAHCGGGFVAYRAAGWRRVSPGRRDIDETDERPLAPKCAAHGWRPSIHMPRWVSRITLEITDVRVQRLQDISEEDAKAEGVPLRSPHDISEEHGNAAYLVGGFASLWDSINDKRGWGWAVNPWVWAISFRRATP